MPETAGASWAIRPSPAPVVRIPVDRNAAIRRGLVTGADTARIVDEIVIDLSRTRAYQQKRYISLGEYS